MEYIVTRPIKVSAESDAEALEKAIKGEGQITNTSINKVASSPNPPTAAVAPAVKLPSPSKK